MNSKLGKVAIAAGLLCTWDQLPAQADLYSFEGSITPSQTLSQVYFVFATGFCNSAVYTHKIADSIPRGVTTPISFQMEMSADDREQSTHEPYGEYQTIFAIYDDANDGVTVGHNLTAASGILAQDPTPEWNIPSISESNIAAMLRADSLSINGYSMFWEFPVPDPPRFANRPYDPDFTLVNFSSATPGGSAIISEVPEPAAISLVLFATALIGLVRRCKCST